MKVQLVTPAAGQGARLGESQPKALVELLGRPLLLRTLDRFAALDLLNHAIIVAAAEHLSRIEELVRSAHPEADCRVVEGASARQGSVACGLDALDSDTGIVVIHDAARPFAPLSAIQASIDAAREYGAATVATPCVDTILVADDEQWLTGTPDRSRLWYCQTPQTFQRAVIVEAHRAAREEGYSGTDDATLVRRQGGRVKIVDGSPFNIKVTSPSDLLWAAMAIEKELV